jgi:16S rRNA G966 N2-methylase RsmD
MHANKNTHNPYLVHSLVTTMRSSYHNKDNPEQKKRWLFENGYLSKSEIDQLQIDDVGLFSITPAKDANRMSTLCANLDGMHPSILGRKPVITDGCACVGGNVLSFALSGLFAEVNGVEFDEARARMLEHNVAVIRDRAQIPVNTFTGSYNDLMQTLSQDIVFLDPPWGGPDYKKQQIVHLFLAEKHLVKIIYDLHSHSDTKYVVWKAPKNFALAYASEKIQHFGLQVKVLEKFKKYDLYYVNLTLAPSYTGT